MKNKSKIKKNNRLSFFSFSLKWEWWQRKWRERVNADILELNGKKFVFVKVPIKERNNMKLKKKKNVINFYKDFHLFVKGSSEWTIT